MSDTDSDDDQYPEFDDRAIRIRYRVEVQAEKVLQYEEIAREAWERGDTVPETDDEIAAWIEGRSNSMCTDLSSDFEIFNVVDADEVEVVDQ